MVKVKVREKKEMLAEIKNDEVRHMLGLTQRTS